MFEKDKLDFVITWENSRVTTSFDGQGHVELPWMRTLPLLKHIQGIIEDLNLPACEH